MTRYLTLLGAVILTIVTMIFAMGVDVGWPYSIRFSSTTFGTNPDTLIHLPEECSTVRLYGNGAVFTCTLRYGNPSGAVTGLSPQAIAVDDSLIYVPVGGMEFEDMRVTAIVIHRLTITHVDILARP